MMKKVLLAFLILSIGLFLFGCDKDATETGSTTPVDTESTEASATENASSSGGENENSPEGVPGNTDVDAAFNAAYDVYQWFELSPLEVETNNGDVVFYTVNGNEYCGKVSDDRASSLEDIKAALQKYFSDDICSKLLGYDMYLEEDGILYEVLADRGGDITRGNIISQEISKQTEDAITYTVTVEAIDPDSGEISGEEAIDYLYEKTDNGWKFTTFESIH